MFLKSMCYIKDVCLVCYLHPFHKQKYTLMLITFFKGDFKRVVNMFFHSPDYFLMAECENLAGGHQNLYMFSMI